MSLDSHIGRWRKNACRPPGFGLIQGVWPGLRVGVVIGPQHVVFPGRTRVRFPVIQGSHGPFLGDSGHGVSDPALAWARGMLTVSFGLSTGVCQGRLEVPSRGPDAAARLGRLSLPLDHVRSRLTPAAIRALVSHLSPRCRRWRWGPGSGFLPHRWHWRTLSCPGRSCIRLRLGGRDAPPPPCRFGFSPWARGSVGTRSGELPEPDWFVPGPRNRRFLFPR